MIKRTPQLPNSDLFISFRYPFWYPRFVGRFSTLALKLVRPAALSWTRCRWAISGRECKKARRSQSSVRAAGKSFFPQLLNRLDEPTGGNLEPTRLRPWKLRPMTKRDLRKSPHASWYAQIAGPGFDTKCAVVAGRGQPGGYDFETRAIEG